LIICKKNSFKDDDFYDRVIRSNYSVSRYEDGIGRYTMLGHVKDKPNPNRLKLYKTKRLRMNSDGLSSLKYHVIKIEKEKLYTKIFVYYDKNLLMKEAEFYDK
jgi:hypothetical protein